MHGITFRVRIMGIESDSVSFKKLFVTGFLLAKRVAFFKFNFPIFGKLNLYYLAILSIYFIQHLNSFFWMNTNKF
jgi:hypothetical protein